jgi:DNA-binding transcriptional LysR family regulator
VHVAHIYESLPPLDGLHAMLAAADAGSFTGAAALLNVTHGSISRRIAVLEAWLGTSIFERHGRGARLTPAGQRFAAEARRTLDALTRSADQWRPRRGRTAVRLSVVPSFGRLWLLPNIGRLERTDIHVDVAMEHRSSDLDGREADLSVRYGRGSWEGLDSRLLLAETLRPAAAPHLAGSLGSAPTPEEMMRVPLLHDSNTSLWSAWLASAGATYRPRWQDRRFEDYDTVIAAAEAGLGVALLRAPLAIDRIAAGRLTYVSERVIANPSAHYICLRSGEQRASVLEVGARLMALADQTRDAGT